MKTHASVTGKILLSFLVAFIAMIIIGVIYAIVAVSSGQKLTDITASAENSLFMGIAQTAFFAASALGMYALFERKKGWALGLRQNNGLSQAVQGLIAGIILITISAVLIWAFGGISWETSDFNKDVAVSLLQGLLLFVCVAVSEEIYSRGYIQGLLRYHYGSKAAIMVSAVLFTLLHSMNPGMFESPLPFLNLLLAGIILALARELTGGLWWPIGLHLTWNYLQGNVYGFKVSGKEMESAVLTATDNGPAWLSGGSFGIEGSLVSVVVLVLGTLCVAYIYRKPNAAKR
ncbi:CPBP family intramembrane glutamic endopeptidase [Paenibacillus sp. NEAU-GSW1]|uniref:CPBP family intramembrane glutamic endopeptidase n=1 Tax=Paenibacillus sp. NEAU-GSW1 TaxID=2682486 RepID=UPI0012E2A1BB|nr:type II CAAX endopeptidase family protein [Paenibacillus sp. NEAU-GSW1]MUT68763.1 CPBP family intramembrane metalloprotease [Paenibacillus sp. NEAU-GSW1]